MTARPVTSSVLRLSSDPDYGAFLRGRLPDPYPLYARLRSTEPVHWSEGAQSWILTRYEDVAFVLQYDPRVTAERLTRLIQQLPATTAARVAPLQEHLRTFVQYYDPPEHTRLRATAAPHFTPRSVGAMRDVIQANVDELLDRVGRRTRVDLIDDLAFPLPATVIAEVLGIPPESRTRFRAWADEITQFLEGVGDDWGGAAERANEAVLELVEFIRVELQEKRLHPRTDLLSRLLGELDDEHLTEGEIFGWSIFLLLAGHETTTGLIGNGLVALLEDPRALAALRSDPDLIGPAVEELLRFDSPIHRISRVATDDIELNGKLIRRGDRIWAMIGAANRDPAIFVNADELDLRRSPNRHLAFGYGIHFCLGASLARLEAMITIPAVLSRYRSIEVHRPLSRRAGVSLHQFRSIPVTVR